ncbi:MAG: hypothetical protein AAF772_12700 [Acidobacteriota bacterium]
MHAATARTLCALLGLLLIVAPLGASLCGSCAIDRCAPTGARSAQVTSSAPRPADDALPPCHAMTAPSAETPSAETQPAATHPAAPDAPCHDAVPSDSTRLDCCPIAVATAHTSTTSLSASAALDAWLDAALAAPARREPARAQPRGTRHLAPPPAVHPPLYTLHAILLI